MPIFKKKRVLFVDDNENLRKTAAAILKHWGFDVILKKSGNEVLDAVREKNPDLVILDVKMPGLNGFELCDILKKNSSTNKVPVILLTGYSKMGNVDEGFRCGADEYVTKPVSWDRLKKKVEGLLKIKI